MRNIDIPQVTDLARLLERRDSIFQGASKQGELLRKLRSSANSKSENTSQRDVTENTKTDFETRKPNEKIQDDESLKCN